MRTLLSNITFAITLGTSLMSVNLVHAADLSVEIDDVKSADGRVMLALFDSADSFLVTPFNSLAIPAVAGTTRTVVTDLPPGNYAIAVYHDENGNGRLDRNSVGIPIEDFAFSNNAMGKRGAPSFDDARISLPAAGAAIHISLR